MNKKVLANEILLEEAGKLLNEGREVVFTPLGCSMQPFIEGGRDQVRLLRKDSVEVGDIVLARLTGRYVMHRVFSIDGERIVLMGDGNIAGTEQCRRQDIMGTVTAIIKEKRTVIPGKGTWWRRLLPIRRYILAIYRRLP